ncbi:MAG: hypothetical protein WC326_15670 [Candidatus Delongbacteria bacterium]
MIYIAIGCLGASLLSILVQRIGRFREVVSGTVPDTAPETVQHESMPDHLLPAEKETPGQ